MKTFISIVLWPIWFFYFSITIIILFVLFFIIPPKKLYIILRPLCWSWCFMAGQWLGKKNMPPSSIDQPYIYMFNHSSMFDQFMIGAYTPHYITAVAAIEIFKYPIFGYIIKKYGIIPIARKNIKKAISSLTLVEKHLKNGTSFLISPEGTRSKNGELLEFKKGPFHLAKNTKTTIIPIGLLGAFEAKKKTDWRLSPGKVLIKFGKPITYREFEDMSIEELRDFVKKKIDLLIKDEDKK